MPLQSYLTFINCKTKSEEKKNWLQKTMSDLIVLPLLMRLGPAFAKNLQADWLFVKAFWRLFWRLSKKYVFGVLSGSLLFVTSGAFDMASSSSVHSILKNCILLPKLLWLLAKVQKKSKITRKSQCCFVLFLTEEAREFSQAPSC